MNDIRKTIFLQAPVERVWRFLTDQEKLSLWLMEANLIDLEEGTRFAFTAEPSGSWDGKIYCEITELIDLEHIAYTWNANDIGAETLVTFDLEPVRNGTNLTLSHTNFETAAGGAEGRHSAGWHKALKALVASLEDTDEPYYDWTEFKVTYFVERPLTEVYSLWSNAAGMQRFWADEVSCVNAKGISRDKNKDYENGDKLTLMFPTATGTTLEILNIEKDKFVLFSFGEGYGWVQVSFSLDDDRTKIVLQQFGMPDDNDSSWQVHANARGWWVANLINIKSVLLYNNDLRVRSPDTSSGLGTQFLRHGAPPPETHDWAAFDVFLEIDAPPESVMNCWRTAHGIQQFFIAEMKVTGSGGQARMEDDTIQKDDTYWWHYVHDYTGQGQFLSSSENQVRFTFGTSYQVEITAVPADNGTLLHLKQTGMSDSMEDRVHGSLNCRSCWINFIVNLKSVLEHGIDLRDKNPATTDSVSVGYNP
jgi:uncharacterized protein YndB with AHSA1/START domain